MADIHNIETERRRRKAERFMEDVRKFKGFQHDLELCTIPVHFTGYVTGSEEVGGDQLRIVIYDTSQASAQAIGAIRIARHQWSDLKSVADMLLDAHA